MKIIKDLLPYILIIAFVVLIRTFIITPVKVDGISMFPTLSDGQVLLLKKFDKSIERFDIIVIDYDGTKLIKRVIGLPGERLSIEDNNLYINGELVDEEFLDTTTTDFDLSTLNFDFIPNNYYFVMGDNRNNSVDSRVIGFISIDDIMGTADFSIFPFNTFGKID
ncbi:MAG: signal peptidase I [Bacilli bacterium]|nr:signal peptidase I [Bacilli bacterium]